MTLSGSKNGVECIKAIIGLHIFMVVFCIALGKVKALIFGFFLRPVLGNILSFSWWLRTRTGSKTLLWGIGVDRVGTDFKIGLSMYLLNQDPIAISKQPEGDVRVPFYSCASLVGEVATIYIWYVFKMPFDTMMLLRSCQEEVSLF